MRIKLKILTPVHIGSGNEISPLEYLIEENKFYRLDMDGLFQDPDFKKFFNSFIDQAKSKRYIGDILPKDLLKRHILYILNVSAKRKFNLTEIKEITKSAGRVYIPGSSLKGSILSGILEDVLYKNREFNRNFTQLLDSVLGEITASPERKRFARWIDMVDSNFRNAEDSLEISVVDIVSKKQKVFSIIYETIREGIEFFMEIKSHCRKSEQEILEIADNFYRKVYEREKEFPNQSLPALPQNGYILRIGQGSTAWSTSFLILADELGIKNYTIQRPRFQSRIKGPPRSRKLVSGTKSMGWICAEVIR